MIELSIIIVNYNTADLLLQTIRSVIETVRAAYEVIVVDNASTDNSCQLVGKTYGDRVRWIQRLDNAGFGVANNDGILHASGQYILFLNPDTIALPQAIDVLLNYLKENPRVGACGGNLLTQDRHHQLSYWTLFPGVRYECSAFFTDWFLRRRLHGNQEWNATGHPMPVAHICGADLMVRKEVVDRIGLFDPDFFLFYEETDLCCRIQQAGYEVMSVPQAEIIHLESQTIGSLMNRLPYMMTSRNIYLRKHTNPFVHYLCNVILWFSCSIRQIGFRLNKQQNKYIFWTTKKTLIWT